MMGYMKPMIKPKIPFAKNLRAAFPQAEIFLVGGMVRDLLLGRASKDVDLVVRGVPLPRLISFLKKSGRVDVVGKTFGVIKFNGIDIALPRTEIAGGSGAYRDFVTHSKHDLPLVEDLSRRDFTINAMALNIFTGELVDPFGGAADLKKKIIRAVGKPADRFAEDHTRVLRALRFACQLNFKIDPTTWRALKKSVTKINGVVPPELIGREFLKSLVANPEMFMKLWDESGAFKQVAPELLLMHKCPQPKNYHNEGDVWKHTVLALKNIHGAPYKKFIKKLPTLYKASAPASPTQYVATLLHDVAKPLTIQTPKKDGVDRIRFSGHDNVGATVTRTFCERLRLSSVEGLNVDTELAAWLVDHHLLAVQAEVATLKETTIEKYFLRDLTRGRELLTMLFADGSATIPARPKDKARHLDQVLARIKKILGARGPVPKIPKPLVDGKLIMREFKISPGPKIGELLEFAREAQLSGRAKTKTEILKLIRRAFF